jgi:hypothetical protein
MNFRHTYTSSEDVVARCVRRRSAFNIFNKEMMTANQSAEFAKAQMLKRKGLGGTTIFITSEEEANLLASLSGSGTVSGSGSGTSVGSGTVSGIGSSTTTPSGTEYVAKCVPYIRKKTVLPLKNRF